MEIKFENKEHQVEFMRMLFEILLALARSGEKDEQYFRAVSNTETMFYSCGKYSIPQS